MVGPKKKFDRKLLDETLLRDGARIDTSKPFPEKLNRNAFIPLICGCEDPCIKIFRTIVENGGARCPTCTQENMRDKNRRKTNKVYIELLNETLLRDGARIDTSKPFPETLNRDAFIPLICGCEDPCIKNVRHILESSGARCPTCTMKNRRDNVESKLYTTELLNETLLRDGARIDTSKPFPEKLNRDAFIPLICGCEDPCIKNFRQIVECGGARCPTCTEKNKQDKMEKTCMIKYGVAKTGLIHGIAYDNKLLNETLLRDGARIDTSKPFPEKLNRDAFIPLICGCEDPCIKIFRTIVENGGARCPTCTQENSREKTKNTCMTKYNTQWAMQNVKVLERSRKNAYKRKEYTTPSGKIWSLQGFEIYVAPKLIKEYGEDDIINEINHVPCINWSDSSGDKHKYYCDFYIKSQNTIIEIKSTWTEYKNSEKIEKTRTESNKLGYNYRLIVSDKNGNYLKDEFYPATDLV